MAKKATGPRGPNRKRPSPGDTYKMVLDVEEQDIDEDGVTDLIVKHVCLKNNEVLFSSESVWYGLDGDVLDAFRQVLADNDIRDKTETTDRFRTVVKDWRKLSNALLSVTKIGERVSDALGEPND